MCPCALHGECGQPSARAKLGSWDARWAVWCGVGGLASVLLVHAACRHQKRRTQSPPPMAAPPMAYAGAGLESGAEEVAPLSVSRGD